MRNIDSALLRPGRIDVSVKIGSPTDDQIKKLFIAVTKEEENADAFLSNIKVSSEKKREKDGLKSSEFSMSYVQSEIIRYQLDKVY
jgi:ATP-dependent 26S proteasome regulatory subunit